MFRPPAPSSSLVIRYLEVPVVGYGDQLGTMRLVDFLDAQGHRARYREVPITTNPLKTVITDEQFSVVVASLEDQAALTTLAHAAAGGRARGASNTDGPRAFRATGGPTLSTLRVVKR